MAAWSGHAYCWGRRGTGDDAPGRSGTAEELGAQMAAVALGLGTGQRWVRGEEAAAWSGRARCWARRGTGDDALGRSGMAEELDAQMAAAALGFGSPSGSTEPGEKKIEKNSARGLYILTTINRGGCLMAPASVNIFFFWFCLNA